MWKANKGSSVLFFLSALKGEGNNYLLFFRAVSNVTNYMAPSRLHLVLATITVNPCPCPQSLCFFTFQPFMGDNYCDSINNRAFCNYDGGDCCASTVKTKKVRMPLSFFSLGIPHGVLLCAQRNFIFTRIGDLRSQKNLQSRHHLTIDIQFLLVCFEVLSWYVCAFPSRTCLMPCHVRHILKVVRGVHSFLL